MTDVGGVVRAGSGVIEVGAQEGGTQLRDELFHRVAFIAPALAPEIPVKPRGMPRPVRHLMGKGRVVGSRRRGSYRTAASARDRCGDA